MRELELRCEVVLRVRIRENGFATLPDSAIARAAVTELQRETCKRPIKLPAVGDVAVSKITYPNGNHFPGGTREARGRGLDCPPR